MLLRCLTHFAIVAASQNVFTAAYDGKAQRPNSVAVLADDLGDGDLGDGDLGSRLWLAGGN